MFAEPNFIVDGDRSRKNETFSCCREPRQRTNNKDDGTKRQKTDFQEKDRASIHQGTYVPRHQTIARKEGPKEGASSRRYRPIAELAIIARKQNNPKRPEAPPYKKRAKKIPSNRPLDRNRKDPRRAKREPLLQERGELPKQMRGNSAHCLRSLSPRPRQHQLKTLTRLPFLPPAPPVLATFVPLRPHTRSPYACAGSFVLESTTSMISYNKWYQ